MSYELVTSPRCREAFFREAWFRTRLQELRQGFWYHRKLWELGLAAQVYHERLGMGGTALGFAVAEAMPAWLVAQGCDVVATNLPPTDPTVPPWAASGQHCGSLEELSDYGIVPRAMLDQHCTWRHVDMRALPPNLGQYDFVYSLCSCEHLGSRRAGLAFLRAAAACIAPGGWAVHTTEWNTSSLTDTIDHTSTVLFTTEDLVAATLFLKAEGITVLPLDLEPGTDRWDLTVDSPPYRGPYHLNVAWEGFITTSVALIMTRPVA